MLLKSRKSRKIFNHHHYLHSFWKSVRLQGIMNRWIKPRSNLFFPEHKMATSRVLHLVLVIIKTLFKSSFDLGKTATATITHTRTHTSMHACTHTHPHMHISKCFHTESLRSTHTRTHKHKHTDTDKRLNETSFRGHLKHFFGLVIELFIKIVFNIRWTIQSFRSKEQTVIVLIIKKYLFSVQYTLMEI